MLTSIWRTKSWKNMKPIIKTDRENNVALAFVSRLMEGDPEPLSKEGQLLSLLAEVVEIFEKRYDHPHR